MAHERLGSYCPNGKECVYGHMCPNGLECPHMRQGYCRFTPCEHFLEIFDFICRG